MELLRNRNSVYQIGYHIVWCIKYRRPVLAGQVADDVKELHPELKKQLWGGHLWNPSYYAGTVGHISEETIKKYIESQKAGD